MISVILPAHNAEHTIRGAVASVLEQTHDDLELIVIDDDSTDGTMDRVAAFVDARIRTCSMGPCGPSAARNRGIELASGAYVAFIDADDVWLPGKLDAQLRALQRSPDAAAAYCWSDYIDVDGRFICPDSRPTHEGRVLERLLVRNFIDSGSNILVRKRALMEIGGFDETLPVVEDWDLSLRLAARHDFACVPAVHVLYRLSPASLSTNVAAMEACYRRVMERAFEAAPQEVQHLKPRSAALFYEYLTAKATQGCPTRRSGMRALRFFGAALRHRPLNAGELWARPWVLKATAKAMLSIVLPAAVMRRLVQTWPRRRPPRGPRFRRP